MKIVLITLTVLTGILIFSTTVCGLWMRFSGVEVAQSSIDFHVSIAAATVLFTVATLALSVYQALAA